MRLKRTLKKNFQREIFTRIKLKEVRKANGGTTYRYIINRRKGSKEIWLYFASLSVYK